MPVCHIALGSNLGDPRANLDAAVDELARAADLRVIRVSPYYGTSPAGGPPDQPPFLNAAAELSTERDPFELLECLQHVERRLGRQRRARWEARTLDLDLLLYEERTIDDPRLQIPHPRMHFRRFVLEPLSRIAPELRHPVMGWTIRALWENLLRRPLYLALAGPPACGKSALARRIARATGAELVCRPAPPQAMAVDPSRPDPPLPVQYLEMCAQELHRRRGDEKSGWIVSDYWLDQVWLAQRRLLSAGQIERFRDIWQEMRQGTWCPTLVAWIDVPRAGARERFRERDAEHFSARLIDRECAEVFGYIDRQQPAPIVRLDGEDLDTARREVLAAMQAAAG